MEMDGRGINDSIAPKVSKTQRLVLVSSEFLLAETGALYLVDCGGRIVSNSFFFFTKTHSDSLLLKNQTAAV